MAGVSMSEYLLREIRRSLERPTRAELIDRIAAQPAVDLDPPAATLIREERDRR